MMNRSETVLLLRKVRAYCPSQAMDELTPEAWAEALADISFEAANDALVAICREPLDLGRNRYIEPGHIIGQVRAAARRRLDAYGTPTPPRDLDEGDWREWNLLVARAIADGNLLPGDPAPGVAELRGLVKAIDS